MKYANLAEMFFSKREEFSDHIAYRFKKDNIWHSMTFGEAIQKAEKITSGFASLGIKKGDKLGLMSTNCWEWVISDFAALALGACLVPIYPSLSPEQIKYILNDSGAKILIVEDETQVQKVDQIADNIDHVAHFFVFEYKNDIKEKRWSEFESLIDKGAKHLKDNPDSITDSIKQIKPDDVATIVYTSGTTGEPKGVVLTHKNFISNVESVSEFFECSPEDTDLSFLPLSHILERTAGHFFTCYHAATVAFAEAIDTIADDIQTVKPTLMVSVPRLYEKMHSRILEAVEAGPAIKRKLFFWAINTGREYRKREKQGRRISFILKFKKQVAAKLVFSKLQEKFGGNLRFFISGGAPLLAEIGEFFAAAGIYILEGYGLTETSPGITFNKPDAFKFGTVGSVLPGIEVKIAEDGEILARGDNIMKGYYNKEAETREVIDENGWFHTGDIGNFDEEGLLVITDRKKNIIVTSGGKNIAPQPIENSILASKFIEQVVVLGDKRRFCSALIVPVRELIQNWASDNEIDDMDYNKLLQDKHVYDFIENEIDRFTQNFSNFERIKKFFIHPEPLTQEAGELTPTLKIKRQVIEHKFAKQIDQLYEM
jgi:long-chain acyl-CoA synthetase